MAEFNLTVPDDQVGLVIESLVKAGGGTPTGDMQKDSDAAKQTVINFITQTVTNVVQSETPPPPPPPAPELNLS